MRSSVRNFMSRVVEHVVQRQAQVVDANAQAIARARQYFAAHPDTSLYPPRLTRSH